MGIWRFRFGLPLHRYTAVTYNTREQQPRNNNTRRSEIRERVEAELFSGENIIEIHVRVRGVHL